MSTMVMNLGTRVRYWLEFSTAVLWEFYFAKKSFIKIDIHAIWMLLCTKKNWYRKVPYRQVPCNIHKLVIMHAAAAAAAVLLRTCVRPWLPA